LPKTLEANQNRATSLKKSKQQDAAERGLIQSEIQVAKHEPEPVSSQELPEPATDTSGGDREPTRREEQERHVELEEQSGREMKRQGSQIQIIIETPESQRATAIQVQEQTEQGAGLDVVETKEIQLGHQGEQLTQGHETRQETMISDEKVEDQLVEPKRVDEETLQSQEETVADSKEIPEEVVLLVQRDRIEHREQLTEPETKDEKLDHDHGEQEKRIDSTEESVTQLDEGAPTDSNEGGVTSGVDEL